MRVLSLLQVQSLLRITCLEKAGTGQEKYAKMKRALNAECTHVVCSTWNGVCTFCSAVDYMSTWKYCLSTQWQGGLGEQQGERRWASALTETTDELQISAKIWKRIHSVRGSVHIPCVHSPVGDLRFLASSMCFVLIIA